MSNLILTKCRPFIEEGSSWTNKECITLDGTNEAVVSKDNCNTILSDNEDLTACIWVMILTGATSWIWCAGQANTAGGWGFGLSGGTQVVYTVRDNNYAKKQWYYNNIATIADGAWHHLALSWNNTTEDLQCYFDGSNVTAGINKANDDNLVGLYQVPWEHTVGCRGVSDGDRRQYTHMKASEIAIFKNKVLSDAEITTLYNGRTLGFDITTNSGNYTSAGYLRQAWGFGDINGDNADGATGTIYDGKNSYDGDPENTESADIGNV